MTEKIIYKRPKSWVKGVHTHYCPGCTHGIVHRMICEVLDELDIQQETVGVAPVGCAALMYGYIDTDFIEAPHGRAPAIATGFKRIRPDRVIFTYQGDGDLASIGAAEIVHAAKDVYKRQLVRREAALAFGAFAPSAVDASLIGTARLYHSGLRGAANGASHYLFLQPLYMLS